MILFRASPLMNQIRQNSSLSSDSRQQYLGQQYPPHLLLHTYTYDIQVVLSPQKAIHAGCMYVCVCMYVYIYIYIYIYICIHMYIHIIYTDRYEVRSQTRWSTPPRRARQEAERNLSVTQLICVYIYIYI